MKLSLKFKNMEETSDKTIRTLITRLYKKEIIKQ